jgi:hypothetical protein
VPCLGVLLQAATEARERCFVQALLLAFFASQNRSLFAGVLLPQQCRVLMCGWLRIWRWGGYPAVVQPKPVVPASISEYRSVCPLLCACSQVPGGGGDGDVPGGSDSG